MRKRPISIEYIGKIMNVKRANMRVILELGRKLEVLLTIEIDAP
jgi:hypothetical protein